MKRNLLTPAERRALKLKVDRARREDIRTRRIVAARSFRETDRLMREGGSAL